MWCYSRSVKSQAIVANDQVLIGVYEISFNEVLILDFVRFVSLFSSSKWNLFHSVVLSKIKELEVSIRNCIVFLLGIQNTLEKRVSNECI